MTDTLLDTNISLDRVSILRRRILERHKSRTMWDHLPPSVQRARVLRASEGEPSWQVRRGLMTRDLLSEVVFEVDDLELLVGRHRRGADCTPEERLDADAYLRQYPSPPGQTGHCELDLQPLMEKGVAGLMREIEALHGAATGEKADTYRSFLLSLEGLRAVIASAARAAESAMDHATPERRIELDAMAEACRNVVDDPPRTFREALQLMWLALFAVPHSQQIFLVGPGHIDRLLGPFYEADRAGGRLTQREALELIESLYLLLNDYIDEHLAIPVMVGGRDSEGRDVTNDLSHLCLEALRRTRMVYPTVGICWHEGTPRELVDLAIDLISQGYSTPAFFGDETIQKGLMRLGVPKKEACHYINSTCVEITPSGSSNVWVASPYFPTCKYLLDEISEQARNPAGQAADFEGFLQSYLTRLARYIADAAAAENSHRRARQTWGRKPLQSVFTRDCVARGRDIDDGGALYNWVENSFVGLANLADSLHVIREEVFEEGRMTLAEMKQHLDSDFEGNEALRMRFLNGHDKYGNDSERVDALFGRIVAFVQEECARYPMEPDGSHFVPGAFAWIMHQMLGSECGATPDGRRAGTPFADGCGPAQGRESSGPTAAILSTTSWDHSRMIGGLAYNMRFSPSFFRSPGARERLRELVLTFIRQGGFETQINVVDTETLRMAREHPDAYSDLVVRIGGYTDYFTRLSPEMQNEIIMRTEFDDA